MILSLVFILGLRKVVFFVVFIRVRIKFVIFLVIGFVI